MATFFSSGASSTGAGAAAGNPAATSAAPSTVKVGETLNLVEQVFGSATKASITLTNLKTKVKSTDGFSKPAKGQFITADVAVVVTEGKFSINSSSFKLVAADGTAYDTTIALNGKDLSANDLTPGQKTAGQITFDAAVGAEKGGKIALTDVLADGDAGYWTM